MDRYEKVGYGILGALVFLYLLAMTVGMLATLPWGLLGLVMLVGIGALTIKVIKERLENTEDDYYSKKVNK